LAQSQLFDIGSAKMGRPKTVLMPGVILCIILYITHQHNDLCPGTKRELQSGHDYLHVALGELVAATVALLVLTIGVLSPTIRLDHSIRSDAPIQVSRLDNSCVITFREGNIEPTLVERDGP
jgi:hypothetical protein